MFVTGLAILANSYPRLRLVQSVKLIFGAEMPFAPKVVVAPKVAFLPQKSFHILIAFADYDLPVAISEFVLCWPLGFLWSVCWLGWKSTSGWFLFDR